MSSPNVHGYQQGSLSEGKCTSEHEETPSNLMCPFETLRVSSYATPSEPIPQYDYQQAPPHVVPSQQDAYQHQSAQHNQQYQQPVRSQSQPQPSQVLPGEETTVLYGEHSKEDPANALKIECPRPSEHTYQQHQQPASPVTNIKTSSVLLDQNPTGEATSAPRVELQPQQPAKNERSTNTRRRKKKLKVEHQTDPFDLTLLHIDEIVRQDDWDQAQRLLSMIVKGSYWDRRGRTERFISALRRGIGIQSCLQSALGRWLLLELMKFEEEKSQQATTYQHRGNAGNFRRTNMIVSAVAPLLGEVLAMGDSQSFGELVSEMLHIDARSVIDGIGLASRMGEFLEDEDSNESFAVLWNCLKGMGKELLRYHKHLHDSICRPLSRLTAHDLIRIVTRPEDARLAVVNCAVDILLSESNMMVAREDCNDHLKFWELVSSWDFLACPLNNGNEQSAWQAFVLRLLPLAPPNAQKQIVDGIVASERSSLGDFNWKVQMYQRVWERYYADMTIAEGKRTKRVSEWVGADVIDWLKSIEWMDGADIIEMICEHIEVNDLDVASFLDTSNGQFHELHQLFSVMGWMQFLTEVDELQEHEVGFLAILQRGKPVTKWANFGESCESKEVEDFSQKESSRLEVGRNREDSLGGKEKLTETSHTEDDKKIADPMGASDPSETTSEEGQTSMFQQVYTDVAVSIGTVASMVSSTASNLISGSTNSQPNPSTTTTEKLQFQYQPKGLPNLGNTCFMNAGLQCISQTPGFVEFILEMDSARLSGSWVTRSLFKAYQDLLRNMHLEGYGCVSRHVAQHYHDALAQFCPLYTTYRQLDACESFSVLLDGLHQALIARQETTTASFGIHWIDFEAADRTEVLMNTSLQELTAAQEGNFSMIKELFWGYFLILEQCLNCGQCEFRYEPWKTVQLAIDPLSYTFDDAFQSLTLPQVSRGSDYSWTCATCGAGTGCARWKKFHHLPRILIFNICRAHQATPFSKLRNRLDYPSTLTVETWHGERAVYENYAACLHGGSTTLGGHYTAVVRGLHSDDWFSANDSSVRRIGQQPRQDGRENVIFYVRRERV